MIMHHPGEEILLDYGTGSLSEALALAVATHVSMCSICSAHVHLIERCGAALLEGAAGDDLSEHALEDILERLDTSGPIVPQQVTRLDKETEALLPGPLRRYVAKNLVDLDWRRVGRLFEEYRLRLARSDIKAALYRLPPGSLVPKHSHLGQEYTLVLAGGFRDGHKTFARGTSRPWTRATFTNPLLNRTSLAFAWLLLTLL